MPEENKISNVVFLKGITTNLRPFSKTDLPNIIRWINDPEIREFITQSFPQSEKQEEDWLNKLGSNDKNIVLAIETKSNQFIGIMGIHDINWLDRRCTTGAIIGEKEYWGKGYGTDAKMQLINYAFNNLNLHKICSGVLSFNKRSLRYSLHCGYKIEGRRKEHIFKNGKYWSIIELGLFKKDWLPIWKKYQKTGKVR